MARRKAPLQAQIQQSSSCRDVSTGTKLSAREYYNHRYKKVDKSTGRVAFTPIPRTFTLIVSRDYGESASFPVWFHLLILPAYVQLFRYCKIVEIDPYHTLKRSKEGRIKNFFHWLCNTFSVKKASSIETYSHQLSQLYIKWKGRRMSPLALKQIYDVRGGKENVYSDPANAVTVHPRALGRRTCAR